MSLEIWNEQYSSEGRVTYVEGEGGLPCARVANDHCAGEMYLHGAHVTAFQPAGQKPVLWMSDVSRFAADQPIRGGVPICWPWFGPHPKDSALPQHGLARISDWELAKAAQLPNGATELVMRLIDSPATQAAWPHAFELMMRACFGEELTLELAISNPGAKPFEFAAAIHTYFRVDDIEAVTVKGLAGRSFVDQLDNDAVKVQSGSIRFQREVDRVYLDTEDEVVIEQQGRPPIHVNKTGSRSTVVWNPWVAKSQRMEDFPDQGYRTMLCIETTNAETDARTLAPSQSHVIRQTVAVGE